MNVEQTKDTSRDKVMTFSYDMSLEPKYDKPTYPGTGNGLGGEAGEYDVSIRTSTERTLDPVCWNRTCSTQYIFILFVSWIR